MNGAVSSSEKLALKRSKEIDEYLKKDKLLQSQNKKGPKILLLGSGDSGKTTVLKQMKLIHGNGFSKEERLEFKQRIFENILECINTLIESLQLLNIPLHSKSNNFYSNQIKEFALNDFTQSLILDKDKFTFPLYIINAIKMLWQDLGIKQCFSRANEFFLQDTAEYMLDNLDRFVDPNFIPSDEDILKTRYRTTQISETKFHIDNLIYRIYDVGGQRSLRLVWAPYFEGEIHAIQFIVSLASYDQQLVEAKNENRMIDSIELFKSICDNKLLEGVNFILFLNKIDLFERKILTSPIKDYFSDFEETNDDSKKLKNACRYFKNKFLCCNSQTERKIYTHFTCGTDTALMKVTINAVRDIVTRLALQASGIY